MIIVSSKKYCIHDKFSKINLIQHRTSLKDKEKELETGKCSRQMLRHPGKWIRSTYTFPLFIYFIEMTILYWFQFRFLLLLLFVAIH